MEEIKIEGDRNNTEHTLISIAYFTVVVIIDR
jgi:hypothetical protein